MLSGIVSTAFWPILRLRVSGEENLPREGAFIVAPNHYSEIDPLIVGLAVWRAGRAPRFLAKSSLFRVPVLGWILRSTGQIPVEREGNKREGGPVQAAAQLAELGRGVIIYPEGTLTRDPELWPMRGKPGVARVAAAHDIPVIPVAHWGAQLVMPRYGKRISLFPRKDVRLVFGAPIRTSELEYTVPGGESGRMKAVTEHVMREITAELETLRGEKAPGQLWDPLAHDQKETGRFDS